MKHNVVNNIYCVALQHYLEDLVKLTLLSIISFKLTSDLDNIDDNATMDSDK